MTGYFLHSWGPHWPSNWWSKSISFRRCCRSWSFRLWRSWRSSIELRLYRSWRSWLKSGWLLRMVHDLLLLNRLSVTLISTCWHDRGWLITCRRIHLLWGSLRRSKSLRLHLWCLSNRISFRRRSFSLSWNFSHCLHISSWWFLYHYRLKTLLHWRSWSSLIDLLNWLRRIVSRILIKLWRCLGLDWSLSHWIWVKSLRNRLSLIELWNFMLFWLKHRRIIPVYRILIILIPEVLHWLFLW